MLAKRHPGRGNSASCLRNAPLRLESFLRNDCELLRSPLLDFFRSDSFQNRFCNLQIDPTFFTTSRIKIVRAGELDCPQDNQAQQASTEFRFETGLSIFFYSVVNWAFFHLVFIRRDCQSAVFPEVLKICFKNHLFEW